jgi:sterol desaturase/sphingolipid hydroxylase (fatty acid hydroxylase superfamily)
MPWRETRPSYCCCCCSLQVRSLVLKYALAHNLDRRTIQPNITFFGVSCYRRRPAAHICHAALLGPSTHGHMHRRVPKVSAAAAAAGASPAPPSNSKGRLGSLFSWLPDQQSMQLVSDAWALLYRNLWAVVAIFLAKDAAAFVLHRLIHRLTNHSE